MKKTKQDIKKEAQITDSGNKDEIMLKERVKKSELVAKDEYDYQRLVYKSEGLLDCTYIEALEEMWFCYNISGKRPFQEIWKESKEKRYQLLINFAKLWVVCHEYRVTLCPDNLYFDENYLLYIKNRDVFGKGKGADMQEFLEIYKIFTCGLLGKKYTIDQILESGLAVLKGNKIAEEFGKGNTIEEFTSILYCKKRTYLEWMKRTRKEVSRKGSMSWRIVALVALVGMLAGGGYSLYAGKWVIPDQKSVIEANQAYIQSDYVDCIDSLKKTEVENMDADTKYILAVSYAKSENFRKEEIDTIVARLSPSSNVKELEYWIYLGRIKVEEAQNLALSLSDDKLLIYAYMKESDILESNTTVKGEEKKSRLDQLEQEITKLGKKYEETEAQQ